MQGPLYICLFHGNDLKIYFQMIYYIYNIYR